MAGFTWLHVFLASACVAGISPQDPAGCWWTGCQPSTWAVRGCEQYNLGERDKTHCEGGNKYQCCPKNDATVQREAPPSTAASVAARQTASPALGDAGCWWTGCQLDSWAVRGCEQYDLGERDTTRCEGGIKYQCCAKNGASATVQPRALSSTAASVAAIQAASPALGGSGCWWTGCQLDSWAVRGCDHYGLGERDKTRCDGGIKYQCCPKHDSSGSAKPEAPSTEATVAARQAARQAAIPAQGNASCWWTGCQLDSWAVRGCEQYDLGERDKTRCEGGNKYQCCAKHETGTTVRAEVSAAVSEAASPADQEAGCWWTGCQPNTWPVRGCDPSGSRETAKTHCKGGYKYQCCRENNPQHTETETAPAQNVTYRRFLPTAGNKRCFFSACQTEGEVKQACPGTWTVQPESACDGGQHVYKCCVDEFRTENREQEQNSRGSFLGLVKNILLKSRNMGAELRNLQCTVLDPKRELSVEVDGEKTSLCDLCPQLPQLHAPSGRLARPPALAIANSSLSDCLFYCHWAADCVALSHNGSTCQLFNSTAGRTATGESWQTIFQTQPTGAIDGWGFSRHTSYSGAVLGTSVQEDFLRCLEWAQSNPEAHLASFDLLSKKCESFATVGDVREVNMVYGTLAAFKLDEVMDSSDVSWRFASARHPTTTEENSALEALLQERMNQCLKRSSCYGVDVLDRKTARLVEEGQAQTAADKLSDRYLLKHPVTKKGIHRYLEGVEVIHGLDISFLPGRTSFYKRIRVPTLRRCLHMFTSYSQVERVSFSAGICKVSSSEVALSVVGPERGVVGAIRTANMTSPLRPFVRILGFSLDAQPHISVPCDGNCEIHCATLCTQSYSDWCMHVVLDFSNATTTCMFYTLNQSEETNSVASNSSMILTRIGHVNFTLENLDKLADTQESDLETCFGQSEERIPPPTKKNLHSKRSTTPGGHRWLNSWTEDGNPENDHEYTEIMTFDSTLDDNEKEAESLDYLLHEVYRNRSMERRSSARGTRWKRMDDNPDDYDDLNCPACPKKLRAANMISNVRGGPRGETTCFFTSEGSQCLFECLPGYREETKPIAICRRPGPDWDVEPRCDLQDCGAGRLVFLALDTPARPELQQMSGDHVTIYAVLFDSVRKLPVWSAALVQSEFCPSQKGYNYARDFPRHQGYPKHPCTNLKDKQGDYDRDYKGTGYDQGHLTPANIARWSPKATMSINLQINLAPQDRYTNVGPWKRLEAKVACFSALAGNQRSVVVATGVCASTIDKAGSLDVPECFWKMVCYQDEFFTEQVVGFISDNSLVRTPAEKEARSMQIQTPVSQSEVLKLLPPDVLNPWGTLRDELTSGRLNKWIPLSPFGCINAPGLSEKERQKWVVAMQPSKKRNRARRDASESNEVNEYTCTDEELEEFLDFDSDDGEASDDSHDDEQDIAPSVQGCGKRIVGYYTSWGDRAVSAGMLRRLTHVIFAFLEVSADGEVSVGSADRAHSKDAEADGLKARARLQQLMRRAARFPHLKVMFAVGGWENSQYFSGIAASSDKRATFIASVVRLIHEYGFDGVDLDWEHPVTGGATAGVPEDRENYVVLLSELRAVLDGVAEEQGRPESFLVSFAGAAGQWTLDPGFDLPSMLQYADFVNVMTYDYFGAWDADSGKNTGPPAPLYYAVPEKFSGKTNVAWTIKYYVCKTLEPHKVNMGLPFYGRFWRNVQPEPIQQGDGMWRLAAKVDGKFSGGSVAYRDLEQFWGSGTFERHFHDRSKTPYAWDAANRTFLGYENLESLQHKVDFATEHNLGGLMVWALDQDDDRLSMLDLVHRADLCANTDPAMVVEKCSPIEGKRWWSWEDGKDVAGMCGRSAPLYNGFFPVCDPDDPGYSCCSDKGYCGVGPQYCSCPGCRDFGTNPAIILEEPVKP